MILEENESIRLKCQEACFQMNYRNGKWPELTKLGLPGFLI